MKKLYTLFMILFLFACSAPEKTIRRSDFSSLKKLMEDRDIQNYTLTEGKYSIYRYEDSVDRGRYEITYYVLGKEIAGLKIHAEGRTDPDFLYEILQETLKRHWNRKHLLEKIADVLENDAGGKLSYADDSLKCDIDAGFSSTDISLYSLSFEVEYE